jgi:glucose-6-phosphate 1-epimerase
MPLSATEAPSIELRARDGATARIHLDGGHVTSWIPAGGEEQLFVSTEAWYGTGCAIRGGIPVCWPQFGPFGPIRHHGFARLMRWSVVREEHDGDDGARAILRLTDTEETRAQWPFQFNTELSVMVSGTQLRVELSVTNTDGQPFEFTAALHPYFRVRDAYQVQVHGLGGRRFRDGLRGGEEFEEAGEALPITGHIDRVYYDTPDVIEMREPHRTLRIEKQHFPECVVWNPGAEGTTSRADFAAGEEVSMVCVEAAVVRPAVTLAPGESWTGVQLMAALTDAAR